MSILRARLYIMHVVVILLAGLSLAPTPIPFVPSSTTGGYFDLEKEFPNLFLPDAYRGQPLKKIPNEVLQKAQTQVEAALTSVFRRMTVPVVKLGEKTPKMVRYFQYLNERLKPSDPELKIMPRGGVVRSAMGYIYAEMLDGAQKRPPVSSEETLARIANATEDISALKVRGIGSDLDIFLKTTPAHFQSSQKNATEITNSLANSLNLHDAKISSGFKNALLTIGDVADYQTETMRSVRQGGSTLDFLAFDIEKGHFVEPTQGILPPEHQNIVRDLIGGEYSYISPISGEPEQKNKQTIRGIRSLVELPFLKMKDESRLRQELEKLTEDARRGTSIDPKVMEQYEKTVRNARYSAGHNRIYRGKPGSIEEQILALSDAIKKQFHKDTLPEFVDIFPIEQRSTPLDGLHGLPPELLVNVDDFIKHHTDNGVVYHGTPSQETGLAIMRGGFFISKDGQGLAAFGRGTYTSHHRDVARSYAGPNGVVFELTVRKDKRLHILDWDKVKNHPKIQEIERKAKAQNRNIFEVLARDHGVDFIVHEHNILQNADALEIPKSISSLIKAYGSTAENPRADLSARVRAYETTAQLLPIAQAHGESGIKLPATKSLLEGLSREIHSPTKATDLYFTQKDVVPHRLHYCKLMHTVYALAIQQNETDLPVPPETGAFGKSLLETAKNTEEKIQTFKSLLESELLTLYSQGEKDAHIKSWFEFVSPLLREGKLTDSQRISVFYGLAEAKTKDPELLKTLSKALQTDSNKNVRFSAARALSASETRDSGIHDALVIALQKDPSLDVKSVCARSIGLLHITSPSAKDALLQIIKNDNQVALEGDTLSVTDLKRHSVKAILEVDPQQEDALLQVKKWLTHKDEWIRKDVAKLFGDTSNPDVQLLLLDPAGGHNLKMLIPQDPRVIRKLLEGMVHYPYSPYDPVDKALLDRVPNKSAIASFLDDNDSRIRLAAAKYIFIGEPRNQHATLTILALGREGSGLALEAISRFGYVTPEIISIFTTALADPKNAKSVAHYLAYVMPPNEAFRDPIAKIVKETGEKDAIVALTKIDHAYPASSSKRAELLGDPEVKSDTKIGIIDKFNEADLGKTEIRKAMALAATQENSIGDKLKQRKIYLVDEIVQIMQTGNEKVVRRASISLHSDVPLKPETQLQMIKVAQTLDKQSPYSDAFIFIREFMQKFGIYDSKTVLFAVKELKGIHSDDSKKFHDSEYKKTLYAVLASAEKSPNIRPYEKGLLGNVLKKWDERGSWGQKRALNKALSFFEIETGEVKKKPGLLGRIFGRASPEAIEPKDPKPPLELSRRTTEIKDRRITSVSDVVKQIKAINQKPDTRAPIEVIILEGSEAQELLGASEAKTVLEPASCADCSPQIKVYFRNRARAGESPAIFSEAAWEEINHIKQHRTLRDPELRSLLMRMSQYHAMSPIDQKILEEDMAKFEARQEQHLDTAEMRRPVLRPGVAQSRCSENISKYFRN